VGAYTISGVDRRLAVAGRNPSGRWVIFGRAGFLPQVPAHPLHARLFARRPPPAPGGCASRRLRLVAEVRYTPAVGEWLGLRTRRGRKVEGAVVKSTRIRGLRRYGAPYLRRGQRLVLRVSPCSAGVVKIRAMRAQRL